MFIIYNTVLVLLLLFLWPFLLWYMYRRQGNLEGVAERLGRNWPPGTAAVADSGPVWFHGASVGEIQMLQPLVRAWQENCDSRALLVTTVTLTGRRTARRLFPEAEIVLLPLDLPFIWGRFYRHFKPSLLIVAETELWPNLFNFVRSHKLPLVLVNARLSRKSFVNYLLFNFFTRVMFATPDLVIAQDRVSAVRFAALGTPAAKIVSSGNLKFDLETPAKNSPGADLRGLFEDNCRVVVAGSTHPGEEEMILDAWLRITAKKNTDPDFAACLVLAPRHPHRFLGVAERLAAKEINFLKFSEIKKKSSNLILREPPSVLLLDTMGDLVNFYGAADFTIIGGTLIPGVGGHNPLESAAFARMVIHGPHVANFRDGFSCLDSHGGGFEVSGQKALAELMVRCMRDPDFVLEAGRRAQAALVNNRGALAKTMAALKEIACRRK